jgi:hypothetical protein
MEKILQTKMFVQDLEVVYLRTPVLVILVTLDWNVN